MNQKQIIQQLRDKRYTYQQIGNLLDISRQRVQQIHSDYYKYKYKPTPTTHIPKDWKAKKYYNSVGLGQVTGREFLREQIRRRDNHTCQICEKVWKEGQRKFDVHKISLNDDRSYEQCKDFSDWITLCHRCHLNLPEHKEAMTKR